MYRLFFALFVLSSLSCYHTEKMVLEFHRTCHPNLNYGYHNSAHGLGWACNLSTQYSPCYPNAELTISATKTNTHFLDVEIFPPCQVVQNSLDDLVNGVTVSSEFFGECLFNVIDNPILLDDDRPYSFTIRYGLTEDNFNCWVSNDLELMATLVYRCDPHVEPLEGCDY